MAQEAGAEAVLLSTDIAAVLAADHGPGVIPVERPPELASDSAPMAGVVLHALSAEVGLAIDDDAIVVLLQPTSRCGAPTTCCVQSSLSPVMRASLQWA